LSVSLVGGGFVGVESWVEIARWGEIALAGVEPEVGRSSVWDNGELLSWGTYGNLNEVLGVHEVLDFDILTKWVLSEEFHWESFKLAFDHLSGDVLLDNWDFTGFGKAEEGGDCEGKFHYLICKLIIDK